MCSSSPCLFLKPVKLNVDQRLSALNNELFLYSDSNILEGEKIETFLLYYSVYVTNIVFYFKHLHLWPLLDTFIQSDLRVL